MTIIDRLIEAVVLERAPRIRRDAEALLAAALWRDFPTVAIVDDAQPGAAGYAIGSGGYLAQAAGCRQGTVAISVAVSRALRTRLEHSPDDFDLAVECATIRVEVTAAHEAAHAVVAPLDADVADDQATAVVARAVARLAPLCPARTAAGHPIRWAAAYGIIAARCASLRPAWGRKLWRDWVVGDIANYGHDAAAIEAAIGEVPVDVPLRELFAPGGEIANRIAAVERPESERLDIIRAWFDKAPTPQPLVAVAAAGVPDEVCP